MKLVWSKSALADRRAIYNRIARNNPMAAIALDTVISSKAKLLRSHSALGRIGRHPGTRELVLHSNYFLVYMLGPDQIQILRVLHVARRWP